MGLEEVWTMSSRWDASGRESSQVDNTKEKYKKRIEELEKQVVFQSQQLQQAADKLQVRKLQATGISRLAEELISNSSLAIIVYDSEGNPILANQAVGDTMQKTSIFTM